VARHLVVICQVPVLDNHMGDENGFVVAPGHGTATVPLTLGTAAQSGRELLCNRHVSGKWVHQLAGVRSILFCVLCEQCMILLTSPLRAPISLFSVAHVHRSPRLKLWDRPTDSFQKGRLLGTAVIWRWAISDVLMEHAAKLQHEVPVVEVVAVCVEDGCGRERYPFSALLY